MSDKFLFGLIVAAVAVFGLVMLAESCHARNDCLEWKSTERTICTGNEYQKICAPEKVCVRWRTP